jgi:hypothetical protein
MNFEAWRPGNTLIGFPDGNQSGMPSIIHNMDQFFALAKESAALADLCISLLIAGDYAAKHKSGPDQPINCRCVAEPVIPHDVLPPKKGTHRFKIDSASVLLRTKCSHCGYPGLYHLNPNGVYSCPSCIRQGFKP